MEEERKKRKEIAKQKRDNKRKNADLGKRVEKKIEVIIPTWVRQRSF